MSLVNKYQIFCITEGSLQYLWSSTPISTCPNNAGHTVNPESVTYYESSLSLTVNGTTASATPEIMLCNTSGGDVNINLPDATLGTLGLIRTVKTSASNNLNIIPYNSQLIDGSSILTGTTVNQMFSLISDGANWNRVGVTMESQYFNDLSNYLNNSVSVSSAYLLATKIAGPPRHTISTSGAVATLGSYTTAGSYIYMGSNYVGYPISIRSIVRGGTGDIRVYSILGATAIAGATVNAYQTNTIISLPLTNNFGSILTTEDTWEIQIRRNTSVGGGNVFTQSTTIYY